MSTCVTSLIVSSFSNQIQCVITVTLFNLLSSFLIKQQKQLESVLGVSNITLNLVTLIMSFGYYLKINKGNFTDCIIAPGWFETWYLICEIAATFSTLMYLFFLYVHLIQNVDNMDLNNDQNRFCMDLNDFENKKLLRTYNIVCLISVSLAWLLTICLVCFLCNLGSC
jgi:hypothetical protein